MAGPALPIRSGEGGGVAVLDGEISFSSWNVNGLRSAANKGFLHWLETTHPDVLGIQEIRCTPDDLDNTVRNPDGYRTYWAPAERKGYSGVALYTRREPVSVTIGLDILRFDQEGRTITADMGDFILIVTYVPNGGEKKQRVPFKLDYCRALLDHCKRYRSEGRSVVFCGDLNVAHQAIDLAHPDRNRSHTGFLPEERAWLDEVIAAGYMDTFRSLHPDEAGAYSYWSNFSHARERNLGWRIDHFFADPTLRNRIIDARIDADVFGSDHCPVSLTLKDRIL